MVRGFAKANKEEPKRAIFFLWRLLYGWLRHKSLWLKLRSRPSTHCLASGMVQIWFFDWFVIKYQLMIFFGGFSHSEARKKANIRREKLLSVNEKCLGKRLCNNFAKVKPKNILIYHLDCNISEKQCWFRKKWCV